MYYSPGHKKENHSKGSLAQKTSEILKNNNIRLNKRRGQHYLVNQQILNKIIQYADLSKIDTVLDIGAGIGTLTIPLAEQAGKVVAVEQDKRIASILSRRLETENIDNVELLVGDATSIQLPSFNKVVSNLPYKISSPITFKLLNHEFEYAVLMYQKEFAERMVAQPNNSKYSRLSVMMNIYANVEKLFNVSKGAFIPPPQVSSTVMKISPKDVPIDIFLENTIRALFQHKKKKSKKALIESFHEINGDIDKRSAKIIVSKLSADLMEARPFQMEPENIIKISSELKNLLEFME